MSITVSGSQASSTVSLGYTRQKENPRNSLLYCSMGPKFPSLSAFFSLPPMFIYTLPSKFFSCASWDKTGEHGSIYLPRNGNLNTNIYIGKICMLTTTKHGWKKS